MKWIFAILFLSNCLQASYVTNASSGGSWGSITGTLSNQSDLNTALAAKAPTASPSFTGTPVFGGQTASTVPYLDSSKNLTSSSTTPTELGYLHGLTGTTGTGNMVLSASPTLTGTLTAGAINVSGNITNSSGIDVRESGSNRMNLSGGIFYLLTNTVRSSAGTGANGGVYYGFGAASLLNTTTSTGNSAGSLTDTYSHTWENGVFNTNGNRVIFHAAGTFANTASTDKQIKVILSGSGTTTLFDTGALSSITSTGYWDLTTQCQRNGASVLKCITIFHSPQAVNPNYVSVSESLSADLTVKLQTKGTNASDVTAEIGDTTWYPHK